MLWRRYGYYAARCALTIAAFAACWVVFGFLGGSWWQLVTAVFLAVAYTQVSFLGHEPAKQFFRGRRANDAVGLTLGDVVGLSYGWWIGKHNRHHANPNHEDDDPDMDIPALAFTNAQGSAKRGFLRWTAKSQAFLFFPRLLLEGLNPRWASIQAVWHDHVRSRRLEKDLSIAHIGVYLTAVFRVLPSMTAIVFIAVRRGLWVVYMGCSFAPDHKGMPTVTEGHRWDFPCNQALTSRQCGLLRSYGRVLRHLHAVGAPARGMRPVPG